MPLEFIAAPIMLLVGNIVFRKFGTITPTRQKIKKTISYLIPVVVLTLFAGRPWSLIWTVGVFSVGMIVHFAWCLKNGIHPINAEPRAKFLALMGRGSAQTSI
jgi:hypothetical protein